jgi:tetratricopeptide (TPR) repeat protein
MDLAVNVYDMIIREQAAGAEAMVHVTGKYGRYLHEQGQITRAQELYQSCIETYDQYRTGDVYFPAQSAFYMGEIAYEDYAAQETNPETAQLKTQLMQQVEQWYSKAISYRTDYYFMAACVRAGELYEDYANSIAFMDPPPEIADDPEAVDEFYNALYTQFYEPKMQQAQQVYRTAVEKAVNLGVENDWVDQAVEHLELLAPGAAAELGYAAADTTAAAADTTAAGADTTAAPDTAEEGFGEEAGDTGGEEVEAEEETGEEAGEPDQPDEGEEYTPTGEPADDEGGGGCFLWPF